MSTRCDEYKYASIYIAQECSLPTATDIPLTSRPHRMERESDILSLASIAANLPNVAMSPSTTLADLLLFEAFGAGDDVGEAVWGAVLLLFADLDFLKDLPMPVLDAFPA